MRRVNNSASGCNTGSLDEESFKCLRISAIATALNRFIQTQVQACSGAADRKWCGNQVAICSIAAVKLIVCRITATACVIMRTARGVARATSPVVAASGVVGCPAGGAEGFAARCCSAGNAAAPALKAFGQKGVRRRSRDRVRVGIGGEVGQVRAAVGLAGGQGRPRERLGIRSLDASQLRLGIRQITLDQLALPVLNLNRSGNSGGGSRAGGVVVINRILPEIDTSLIGVQFKISRGVEPDIMRIAVGLQQEGTITISNSPSRGGNARAGSGLYTQGITGAAAIIIVQVQIAIIVDCIICGVRITIGTNPEPVLGRHITHDGLSI